MQLDPDSLRHAAELIDQSDALVVAAGAGMGVDSGLPDFRGEHGFWKAYPALGRDRIPFSRIASPQAFRDNLQRAWGFYGHRLQLYRQIQPHAGFGILRRWGEAMPKGYGVFTSNVDGQFQEAGMNPPALEECHGSIHYLQCLQPCSDDLWEAEIFVPQIDTENCLLLNEPPRCRRCGGLARPNIMMFSDFEWVEQRQTQQMQGLQNWLATVERPVVVEIGAGTAIPSVRLLSQRIIYDHGGRLIRINPRESAVPTRFDVGLPCGALEGLSAMDEALTAMRAQ